jgi:hypothetical protein
VGLQENSVSRAFRSDGPVIDIHCHQECTPAAEFTSDAAVAAGKMALGHGNPTTQAVNRRQLEAIRPKMDMLDVRMADMDRMGVDVQAVAVAVYQYYYWADADLGAQGRAADQRGVRRGHLSSRGALPATGHRTAAGHRRRHP